ncbi:MAG: glycosyltransferase [Halobacteria archaeon]
MNIALVTLVDITGKSGQNIYSREVVSSLSRNENVDLHLICPQPESEIPKTVRENVASFHFLPAKRNQDIVWHLSCQKQLFEKLLHIVRKHDVEGIVSTLKPSNVLPPLFSLVFGLPYVVLLEGRVSDEVETTTQSKLASFIVGIVERLNLKTSNSVFVPYDELKNWISTENLTTEKKVEVFKHAVNKNIQKPIEKKEARRELGFNEDIFLIGYVGSFKRYHCLEELIYSTKKLIEKDFDVELVMMGEGPEKEKIEMMCRKKKIDDYVRLTGFVPHEEISTYISACDTMYGVIDPDRSGSPMKVFEYLACSRPVVAYRSGDLRFIAEIDAGDLIDKRSRESVLRALEKHIRMEEEELMEMGKNGREYVMNYRTWDSLAEKIVKRISSATEDG